MIEPTRWDRAVREGIYTGSTRGKELDEEGFIHLSRHGQVASVLAAFYSDLADLLVLHVDESRLNAPVVDEFVGTAADGTQLVFPHLYGPLRTDAVVQVDDAASWRTRS